MKKVHVAIGFETVAALNWRDIVPALTKPGNWKEATWLEKLPELEREQEQEVREKPLAGQISELCVISLNDDAPKATVVNAHAAALIAYLRERGSTLSDFVLYGVDIRDRLRQLALQSPSDGGVFMLDSPLVPIKVDVMTLSGLRQAKIPLAAWYKSQLGVPVGGTHAVIEARMVAHVVARSGLPALTDEGIYNH